VTVSRRDLGALDGRRGTGMATTVVGAGRAGGHLPPGRLAPPPGVWLGRGEPYSYLTLGQVLLPIYLAWAARQLPGVEVEEVPT
jgi:hypothetical protein